MHLSTQCYGYAIIRLYSSFEAEKSRLPYYPYGETPAQLSHVFHKYTNICGNRFDSISDYVRPIETRVHSILLWKEYLT